MRRNRSSLENRTTRNTKRGNINSENIHFKNVRNAQTLDAFGNRQIGGVKPKRFKRFIRKILKITNRQRRKRGFKPLRMNNKLQEIAQSHSRDMAVNDIFSHTGLDGSSIGDRLRRINYDFWYAAENIAVGSATPRRAMNQWLNSPGHRSNILNPRIKDIGIGYYYMPNDEGTQRWGHYWTQTFGQPMR